MQVSYGNLPIMVTNESGFSALPAGYYSVYTNDFTNLGVGTGFWVTTDDGQEALRRFLNNVQPTISNLFYSKDYGFSVRCIMGTVEPTVTTASIAAISSVSALSGGYVISDGGAPVTERGMCWSTDPNPTVELSPKTSDGPGIGAFTSTITGLILGQHTIKSLLEEHL